MDYRERLKELIRIAKFHKVAKTQEEFAAFIGAKDGTAISHALKGNGKYKADSLVAKAESALLKEKIPIYDSETLPKVDRKTTEPMTDDVVIRMLEEMAAQREMYDRHMTSMLSILKGGEKQTSQFSTAESTKTQVI